MRLEDNLGIRDKAMDTNGAMIATHVFILKDLRNAIAHNHIVFDCRFKNTGFKKAVSQQLEKRLSFDEITFEVITDYLALIIYYQSALQESKTNMISLVSSFKLLVVNFKNTVSQNIFDQILGTDVYKKIKELEQFVNGL